MLLKKLARLNDDLGRVMRLVFGDKASSPDVKNAAGRIGEYLRPVFRKHEGGINPTNEERQRIADGDGAATLTQVENAMQQLRDRGAREHGLQAKAIRAVAKWRRVSPATIKKQYLRGRKPGRNFRK